MALDSKGHLIDMFDGIKDIKAKALRTVGEADARFAEDAYACFAQFASLYNLIFLWLMKLRKVF